MEQETKMRWTVPLLVTVALLIAACGSSDSDDSSDGAEVATDTGTEAGNDEGADPVEDPGADSGADTGTGADEGGLLAPPDVEMLPFDASALPGTPIGGVGTGSGGGSAVPAVVDTCAALPAEQFTAVVNEAEAEFGFGATEAFAASADGAACRYEAVTHVVVIVIGPGDVVTPSGDSPAVRLPVASGEVSGMPWASDPAITILSEDSFGLDTPFAAHASAADLGVVVSNAGGTGLDPGADGELWARLADAAAAGVAAAPAVENDGGAAAAPPVDPCAVWSVEEIDAFLPGFTIDSNSELALGGGCVWSTPDFAVEVRLRVQDAASFTDGTPVSEGSAVLTVADFFREVWVEQGSEVVTVSVEVFEGDPFGGYAASVALAENLASRSG
ncbi:MAG: hypothetical protein AAGA17_21075 [Actinomycetota bacterium]